MRMNRFAWQDLIESSNFKLRQSLNESLATPADQGLYSNRGVGGIISSSAPTTPPQGAGRAAPGPGPHVPGCPPGSDCSPCGKSHSTHCLVDERRGPSNSLCWNVWWYTAPDPNSPGDPGGWGQAMVCAGSGGGGGGGGIGGGV